MRATPFLAVTAALLLLVSGCADDDGGTPSPTATVSPTASASPSPSATSSASPSARQTPAATSAVSVYLLHGEKLQPVRRTATGAGVAAAAVRALLTGPTAAEAAAGLGTTVPKGTALRSLTIRDRVATVDLTGRYDDGGGTLSMTARLAQVVFTLTRFPTVATVVFWLDGQRVTELGGEGIDLSRPVGRSDYEDLSPAVLVESPRWSESTRLPLRVTGTANVFEAVFFLELKDAAGKVVVDQRVMATSGTGTRGTFDVTLSGTAGGAATLTAYVFSAKDGTRQNIASIPLTLSAP
jgi:hypothetical protein